MSRKLDLKMYKRMAASLEIVMKVFTWVAEAVAIIALTAGIVFTFLPESSGIFNSLSSDSFGISYQSLVLFKLNELALEPEAIKEIITRMAFMIAAVSITFTPIFRQIQLILRTVKVDKPFDGENANRLTKIGFTLIIGSIITRVAEYFVTSAIVERLKIDSIKLNFSPDSNMIIMGFMVLILAGVFKYGSYLQKQYDFTV